MKHVVFMTIYVSLTLPVAAQDPQQVERYLQGFENKSKVIIISMPNDTETITEVSGFDAHIVITPGKKATGRINQPKLGDYIYEWKTSGGTRIFSGSKPNWYANPYHPKQLHPSHTKVYGRYGTLIDDTAKYDSRMQQALLDEYRLFRQTQQRLAKEAQALQEKIDKGVVEIGMTTFEVLAILGDPSAKTFEENLAVFAYQGKQFDRYVSFKDGIVVAIDEEAN